MATITEDYVSFETAKLLKEKGFNGDTASCYILEDSTHHIMSDKVVQNEYYESQDSNEHGHLVQAPTLQMAMKWLREVHNIHIIVNPYTDTEGQHWSFIFDRYAYGCWQELGVRHGVYITDSWGSYEEAVEAAIKYCLENLI